MTRNPAADHFFVEHASPEAGPPCPPHPHAAPGGEGPVGAETTPATAVVDHSLNATPPVNAQGMSVAEAERQAMAALDARIRAYLTPGPRSQSTPPV